MAVTSVCQKSFVVFFSYELILVIRSYTPNASKLIEKHFLDLRNLFSNQENIKDIFSQNKKNKPTEKHFLVPSTRKFDLN